MTKVAIKKNDITGYIIWDERNPLKPAQTLKPKNKFRWCDRKGAR